MKFVLSDLLDRVEPVNSRVVHKDVDDSEVALRLGEDPVHIRGRGHVSLDRYCLAARAHDVGDHLVGTFAAARVIQRDSCAFGRQPCGDLRAYSLRGPVTTATLPVSLLIVPLRPAPS